jgi:hypothetical protein
MKIRASFKTALRVGVALSVLAGASLVVLAGSQQPGNAAGSPSGTAASVPTLSWIKWTAPGSFPQTGTQGADAYTYATGTTGSIVMPDGSTVYVSIEGEIVDCGGSPRGCGASGFGTTNNGWWTGLFDSDGGNVFLSDNVPSLPTNSDRIAMVGNSNGGVPTQTLRFFSDAARTIPVDVSNIVMNIYSVGSRSLTGVWNIGQNFDILSQNGKFTTSTSGSDYVLSALEGTGTLQFRGSFNTITWTVVAPEFYAAWNIGVTSSNAPSDPGIDPDRFGITCTEGAAINPVTFTAANLGTGVTYALEEGSTLPAGLSLNADTGEITGTPESCTAATFVIVATGSDGTAKATLTLGPPTLTPDRTDIPCVEGEEITPITFRAANIEGVVTYALKEGSTLPDGLTLNAVTGEITGRRYSCQAEFSVVVVATGSISGSAEATLTFASDGSGGGGNGGGGSGGGGGGGGAGGIAVVTPRFTG